MWCWRREEKINSDNVCFQRWWFFALFNVELLYDQYWNLNCESISNSFIWLLKWLKTEKKKKKNKKKKKKKKNAHWRGLSPFGIKHSAFIKLLSLYKLESIKQQWWPQSKMIACQWRTKRKSKQTMTDNTQATAQRKAKQQFSLPQQGVQNTRQDPLTQQYTMNRTKKAPGFKSILLLPNLHPRFKCCKNTKWLIGLYGGSLTQSVKHCNK